MKVTISFDINAMSIMSLVSNFVLAIDDVPVIQYAGYSPTTNENIDSVIEPAFTTAEGMRIINVGVTETIDETTGQAQPIYSDGELVPGNYVVKENTNTVACTIIVDSNNNYSLSFNNNDEEVTVPLLTHKIPVTEILQYSAGKNIIGSFYGSSELEDGSEETKVYEIKIDNGAIDIVNDSVSWVFDNLPHTVALYCNDVLVENGMKWDVNNSEPDLEEITLKDTGIYVITCFVQNENDEWDSVGVLNVTITPKMLQIINVQTHNSDKTYR